MIDDDTPEPDALAAQLTPLVLEPIYKEKVWGGRRLERLGRTLPADRRTRIGESWEVADLATTSPAGGGGEAARSRVVRGLFAGRTLHELIAEHGRALLGGAERTSDGAFPLLVKYLDARENLSVQVHPSPAYAARHPDAHLKSEAWYVVDAEPGAVIYKGVVAGTDRATFAAAIEDGTVAGLLVAVPAIAGECHYLPSGTAHALGAGILVAEVQTPSDTTFRVYDWGRTDRALHVAQALECIDFAPARAEAARPVATVTDGGAQVRELLRVPHFGLDEWRVARGAAATISHAAVEVWMLVAGRARLRSAAGFYEPVDVLRGETLLLPASLAQTRVEAIEPVVLLRVTLPVP